MKPKVYRKQNKTVVVYYNGEPYTKINLNPMKKPNKGIIAFALIAIVATFGVACISQITEAVATVSIPVHLSKKTVKDILLEHYLDKLEYCESSGDPLAINPLDGGVWNSRGAYQFQYPTFTDFGIKYGVIADDLEKEDYINLMHDRDTSRKVAKAMFQNDPNAWKHWLNCAKATDLDTFISKYY